jgi:membrane associated rhomboid family serine protease
MTTTDVSAAESGMCFRHLDRAAGVRCQRCGRAICLECMEPAPVGFHCPDCVARTVATQPRMFITGLSRPFVTYALIVANVAMAALMLASDAAWASGEPGKIGIWGALIGGGLTLDGGPHLIGVSQGEWYRILTGAFIHGGVMHVLFNMLALWQAGMVLESALGRVRFTMLYFVSILGGSFGALLLAPDVLTVGASGGVFGLMGALFVAERKGLTGPSARSVGIFIAINLVITVAVPGISIGGHIGGLIAGTAVGWVMFEFRQRQLSSTGPMALAGVLGAALFAGCLWASTFWMDPLF